MSVRVHEDEVASAGFAGAGVAGAGNAINGLEDDADAGLTGNVRGGVGGVVVHDDDFALSFGGGTIHGLAEGAQGGRKEFFLVVSRYDNAVVEHGAVLRVVDGAQRHETCVPSREEAKRRGGYSAFVVAFGAAGGTEGEANFPALKAGGGAATVEIAVSFGGEKFFSRDVGYYLV